MGSFVGTQTDFGSAIASLIELEYDAKEAYDEAIKRIEEKKFKDKLTEFKLDHERHIERLSALLKKHGGEVPTGPDNTKHWIAKGKVVLASLITDKTILQAMKSNEEDTNQAYDQMNDRDDVWADTKACIQEFLQDERRHKAWIEKNIEAYAGVL